MQASTRAVLAGTTLLLLASLSLFVCVNQIAPRFWASDHTAEMCDVLRRINDISQEIRESGDVARLTEIYTASNAAEESKWIQYSATQNIVARNIDRIIGCKAIYYSSVKAEIDVTTWTWFRTFDRRTGHVITPNDPTVLNQARESRTRIEFSNERGVWKFLNGEEYDWRFVNAEPPSP